MGADVRPDGLALDGHRVPADIAILPGLAALGDRPACHCFLLHAVYPRFRLTVRARQRGPLEGARPGRIVNGINGLARENQRMNEGCEIIYKSEIAQALDGKEKRERENRE